MNELLSADELLRKLLEENLRLNRAIYQDTQKIRRYVKWRQIFDLIYIVLIVAPIVLGLVFLPPLLKNFFNSYQELLGGGSSVLDLTEQLKQIK